MDFAYVDGYAHTGHDAKIIESLSAKLKVGSIVAVHDYDRFSWPINFNNLKKLIENGNFSNAQLIPPVLTLNSEDIFPGLIATYNGP